MVVYVFLSLILFAHSQMVVPTPISTNSPTPTPTDIFTLPDCQITSDCTNLEDPKFCYFLECIEGSCVQIPRFCPVEFPVCYEQLRACVGCLSESDCNNPSYTNATWCTGGAYNCSNETLTCTAPPIDRYPCGSNPIENSTCFSDLQQCVFCRADEDCGFTSFCNQLGYCNITSGKCIEYETAINPCFDSMLENESVQCNEESRICGECGTDLDCKTRFSIDINEFCTPVVTCNSQTHVCEFQLLPVDDQGNNPTATIHIPPTFTNLSLYIDQNIIRATPCDSLTQKYKQSGSPIITCSSLARLCTIVNCSGDLDCTDSNDCNGKEICNISIGECIFPFEASCPENTMCEESENRIIDSDIKCVECNSNSDCEPENVCDGIGICNQNTKTCSLMERCDSIVESCDSTINLTQILALYGFSTDNLPPIPTNDGSGLGYISSKAINMVVPLTKTRPTEATTTTKEVLDVVVDNWNPRKRHILLEANNEQDSGQQENTPLPLPTNFDYRKLYCIPILCNQSSDCPLGTICKNSDPIDPNIRMCDICYNDAECQDGIKCNGKEKCHPDGTCRRAVYGLCDNIDGSSQEANLTCIEATGECLNEDIENTTESTVHVNSLSSPRTKTKSIGAVNTRERKNKKNNGKTNNNNNRKTTVGSANIKVTGGNKSLKAQNSIYFNYTTSPLPQLGIYSIQSWPIGNWITFIILPIIIIALSLLIIFVIFYNGCYYTSSHKRKQKKN